MELAAPTRARLCTKSYATTATIAILFSLAGALAAHAEPLCGTETVDRFNYSLDDNLALYQTQEGLVAGGLGIGACRYYVRPDLSAPELTRCFSDLENGTDPCLQTLNYPWEFFTQPSSLEGVTYARTYDMDCLNGRMSISAPTAGGVAGDPVGVTQSSEDDVAPTHVTCTLPEIGSACRIKLNWASVSAAIILLDQPIEFMSFGLRIPDGANPPIRPSGWGGATGEDAIFPELMIGGAGALDPAGAMTSLSPHIHYPGCRNLCNFPPSSPDNRMLMQFGRDIEYTLTRIADDQFEWKLQHDRSDGLAEVSGVFTENPVTINDFLSQARFYSGMVTGSMQVSVAQFTEVVLSQDVPLPECEAGSYDDGGGTCVEADAGHFVADSCATEQVPCPAGTFAAATGSTECEDASPGYFVDVEGAASATPCPVGTFAPSAGSIACTQAMPGHAVDSEASTAQTPCVPGYYQPGFGATACLAADADFHVPGAAATEQIPCPAGTTSPPAATECTPIVVNTAPTADAGGPYSGATGAAIAFDGSASSDPETDPLTYAWDFGDGNMGTGVAPTHSYATSGLYAVCLIVNDTEFDSPADCTTAEISDPVESKSFVTGGGWIDSPAGAYGPDPSLSGFGSFSLVAKHSKRRDRVRGHFRFFLKDTSLSFKSRRLQSLTVLGSEIELAGRGWIRRVGDFEFSVTADDSDPDTIHIRIWDDSGMLYDNSTKQPLAGGEIVIHDYWERRRRRG